MATDSGMLFETHCLIYSGVTRETVVMVMLATVDVASKCLSEMLTLVHRSRLLATADLGGFSPSPSAAQFTNVSDSIFHAIVYEAFCWRTMYSSNSLHCCHLYSNVVL